MSDLSIRCQTSRARAGVIDIIDIIDIIDVIDCKTVFISYRDAVPASLIEDCGPFTDPF